MCSPTVLEARGLKAGCQQGRLPLRRWVKSSTTPPSFWWWPATLGVPWLAAAALRSLLYPHMTFPLSVSPRFLLGYSCRALFPKRPHSQVSGLGLLHIVLEDTIQPMTLTLPERATPKPTQPCPGHRSPQASG